MLLMSPGDTPHEAQRSFLLMRHANRWDLPKGHCEGKETFAETAFREIEEETGISPNRIEVAKDFHVDLRYPVTYKQHGDQIFQKQVRYFLGFLQQKPEIHVTEHESYQWLDWNPPHRIQTKTIDPVLDAVAQYFEDQQ